MAPEPARGGEKRQVVLVFYRRMPFLSPNQSVEALKEAESTDCQGKSPICLIILDPSLELTRNHYLNPGINFFEHRRPNELLLMLLQDTRYVHNMSQWMQCLKILSHYGTDQIIRVLQQWQVSRSINLFDSNKQAKYTSRKSTIHHHDNHLRPFFWDHPGKPVPEENFWTLWCKDF